MNTCGAGRDLRRGIKKSSSFRQRATFIKEKTKVKMAGDQGYSQGRSQAEERTLVKLSLSTVFVPGGVTYGGSNL